MSTATAVATRVRTEWAVFGSDGTILVIFAGTTAYEAAREWQLRGHRIEAFRATVAA